MENKQAGAVSHADWAARSGRSIPCGAGHAAIGGGCFNCLWPGASAQQVETAGQLELQRKRIRTLEHQRNLDGGAGRRPRGLEIV